MRTPAAVAGKRVLLCDDVLTTGTTARRAAACAAVGGGGGGLGWRCSPGAWAGEGAAVADCRAARILPSRRNPRRVAA